MLRHSRARRPERRPSENGKLRQVSSDTWDPGSLWSLVPAFLHVINSQTSEFLGNYLPDEQLFTWYKLYLSVFLVRLVAYRDTFFATQPEAPRRDSQSLVHCISGLRDIESSWNLREIKPALHQSCGALCFLYPVKSSTSLPPPQVWLKCLVLVTDNYLDVTFWLTKTGTRL